MVSDNAYHLVICSVLRISILTILPKYTSKYPRYLVGTGIIVVLHLIPISLSVVYPGRFYRKTDIDLVTVAVFLRYFLIRDSNDL